MGVVVVVAAAILIFALKGGGKNFNKRYSDIADESWCTIAEDGTWMKIDTNPIDVEDYLEYDAYEKIAEINNDLGFSSVVAEEMGQTRALDGRQSADTDKFEVSWSYHPDNGLEVLYKAK